MCTNLNTGGNPCWSGACRDMLSGALKKTHRENKHHRVRMHIALVSAASLFEVTREVAASIFFAFRVARGGRLPVVVARKRVAQYSPLRCGQGAHGSIRIPRVLAGGARLRTKRKQMRPNIMFGLLGCC